MHIITGTEEQTQNSRGKRESTFSVKKRYGLTLDDSMLYTMEA